jgi:hypothetical protein
MRRVALVLVALLALAPTACRRGGEDKPDWRVIQLYGGQGSVAALKDATIVEAFRIEPLPEQPEAGVAFCGVHRVTAGPFPLSPEDAEALSAILRDAGTYDWRRAKGDPYQPTFGVRFTREASRVDLAFDLESKMLTVHRAGRRIGVEDFDDAAEQVAAILRRTVPDGQ